MTLDLRGIDLNLLVALDALLTERHVTRAAARLAVSQPTMSASLSKLRRLLDDQLLVRVGAGLQPTAYAERLQEPVHELLSQIQKTLEVRPEFDPRTDERTLTIATTDYVSLVLIRRLRQVTAEIAPGIHLHTLPIAQGYVEQLRDDLVDLLILPREIAVPMRSPSLALFTDRFVCAVSREHPDIGDVLTRDMLESLPYLAWRAHGLDSYVDRQLDDLGVPRRVEMTIEGFAVAPFLVTGTRMIAMIQEQLGLALADAAGIRLVEVDLELAPITQTMYWHPRRNDDPAHKWLRNQLATVASTIGTSDV